MPSQLFEEELRTNKDRGREVQGGVDEAQRGWEEKEGGGIGSRGRGGVLGVETTTAAPPSCF